MTPLHGNVLLIGYGNPGRLDDGLGPALAAAVREMALERVTVESSYQLAVEHAEQAAHYDVVVFADAAVKGAEPFCWEPLTPTMDAAFSTHSVAPATVLGLAQHLFQATTEGYILGIRGYTFDDFGEHLSPRAQENLAAAAAFFQATFQNQQCKVGP